MPDNPINNLPPHILSQLASVLAPFLQSTGPSTATSNQAPTQIPPPSTQIQPPASPSVQTSSISAPAGPSHSQAAPLQRTYAMRSVLPAITAYQSPRLSAGAPAPESVSAPPHGRQFLAPSSQAQHDHTQPRFLGFEDTRSANSQRLASAAATLPRSRTALALRGARSPYPTSSGSGNGSRRGTRGAAGTLPSLVQTNGVENCIYTNIADGSRLIRLICKVYPPLEAQASDYVVFLQRRDSFNQALAANHLLHKFDVPLDTSVRDILSTLVDRLTQSPFKYSFGDSEDVDMLPHEALPLTMLRISNRARRRPSTNQIHLTEYPVLTDDITLNHITGDTSRFIFQDISFEDNHLVLFFAVRSEVMTARLPSRGLRGTRLHTCIGLRIWSKFPNDNYVAQAVTEDTSGGESDDDDLVPTDEESLPDVGTIIARAQASRSRTTHGRQQQPPVSIPVPPSVPALGASVRRVATRTSLEETLWAAPWVAPARSTLNAPLNLADTDNEIFEMAVGSLPRIPDFSIRGLSTLDLAEKFIMEIGKAVDLDDFTRVLSPNRSFQIDTAVEDERALLSFGRGVEREALHLALQKFLQVDSQWLTPRSSGYSSIAITSRYASTSRLRNLGILGALVGLYLVHGMAPTPVSPALIQLALHNCNFASIHRKFVQEWFPDLYRTVNEWLSTSHTTQDLAPFAAHFSTYHDVQVASLLDRDETGHMAMAGEMLYRATIGPEPPSHPELQAFFKGLRLRCPASGFDLTKLCTLVEGGSEAYLNMVFGSNIKTFDDLAPHLRFKTPSPPAFAAMTSALRGQDATTFHELFEAFMRGAGIPNVAIFDQFKMHFSPLIDLTAITDPGFRARHFNWAATGSPALEVAGEGITIILSGPGDTGYANSTMSSAMMAQGKICFKTCVKQVRIPISFLGTLTATLDGPDPVGLQAAFDNWMLLEILNGIGGHSIL